MPSFRLYCENPAGDRRIFMYSTDDSSLKAEDGSYIVEPKLSQAPKIGYSWDKNNPAPKSRDPRFLKISLGLSCNYSCNYCSQRFVPHSSEGNTKYVATFIERMPDWFKGGEDGLGSGVQIEFWGGEPLVYWKTLRPLAEGIRARYPNARLMMITNGSLLDQEKVEWIDEMGFSIGLSHDGPGYHARGIDPLSVPEQRHFIMDLWSRLAPKGRMSVNAMIHRDNPSRAAVQQHLYAEFGDHLVIGEGSFIDAYDEGGLSSLWSTPEEHIDYRRRALHEIRNKDVSRFMVVGNKIQALFQNFEQAKWLYSINQKCGIDDPQNLTVDLRGNVITCQNVSADAVAPNGESHKCGSVDDMDKVQVKTIRSWSRRENCPNCPVVHVCKGSCTFLEGDLFTASCESSFSDNIVFLAVAVELATGYLPVYIEGPQREDRKDIWGLNGVPDIPSRRKKIIPLVPA